MTDRYTETPIKFSNVVLFFEQVTVTYKFHVQTNTLPDT
jgi:hypothetical protein